jgi:hypothetical protein
LFTPARNPPDLPRLDATVRDHIFCSFLALVLKSAQASRPKVLTDLDPLTETEHEGKRFQIRSAPPSSPRPRTTGIAPDRVPQHLQLIAPASKMHVPAIPGGHNCYWDSMTY